MGPPPAVLATAAALGALDAGPAPSGLAALLGSSSAPQPFTSAGTSVLSKSADLAAGAAPAAEAQTPTITQGME